MQYLACNMKLENEKYFENSRAGSSGAIIQPFCEDITDFMPVDDAMFCSVLEVVIDLYVETKQSLVVAHSSCLSSCFIIRVFVCSMKKSS